MRTRDKHWEEDKDRWPWGAYRVDRYGGVAWRVYGWHTQPDEDTEWSGYENRTGRVVACMVGDDCLFTFDPDEVHRLDDLDYCAECGQIGCPHDGRSR